MVTRTLFTKWLDGSSAQLREVLGELEGVSPETLQKVDRVSRPSADGPVPRYEQDVMLYTRLVLLALAESSLARQQVASSAPKVRKAS